LVAEKAELQSKLHQALKKIDKKQDECDELSGRLKGNISIRLRFFYFKSD
jgi:hypothetical protein